jgi:hypothetical protein
VVAVVDVTCGNVVDGAGRRAAVVVVAAFAFPDPEDEHDTPATSARPATANATPRSLTPRLLGDDGSSFLVGAPTT